MFGRLTCFGSDGGDARVYYLGGTGNVHEAAWSSRDVIWSFTNLTAKINGAVAARPNGALASFASNGTDARVHFLDASAHVCQIGFEGGKWTFHDLTHLAKPADANEPVVPAASDSNLACFGYQGKDTRVQFLDAKANVCQIGFENNQWIFRNLTHESGAPAAANNSALVSFGVAESNARIYFLNGRGHVTQISWNGKKWLYDDLTKAAVPTDSSQPTKTARSGSPLCGFAYAGTDTRVYFQDDASRICEIAYANNRWEFTNMTAVAKPAPNQAAPPVPARDTDLTCLAANGRDTRLYYLDGASFIWELAYAAGWVATAVQLQANSDASWAPAAAPATALACYLARGTYPKVYYFRWQGDVNELTSAGQWGNRTIVATEIPSNPVGGITLKGNSNYSLVSADSQNPNLTGVSVNIDITQPIALGSDSPAQQGTPQYSGFSFQLNALTPSANYSSQSELSVWQQYIIAVIGTTLFGIVNNWTAQQNSQGQFDNPTINTYGTPETLYTFPTPSIPAGFRLTITLWNDSAGNVTSVSFVVFDNDNNCIANVTQQLSSIGGTPQEIAPIVTFLLAFVGPGDNEFATLVTGEGMISYSAAQPLIAQASEPLNLTEEATSTGTFENANTFYGALPQTGGHTGLTAKLLAQPFKVGSKPQ
jgi:hypothetical protein